MAIETWWSRHYMIETLWSRHDNRDMMKEAWWSRPCDRDMAIETWWSRHYMIETLWSRHDNRDMMKEAWWSRHGDRDMMIETKWSKHDDRDMNIETCSRHDDRDMMIETRYRRAMMMKIWWPRSESPDDRDYLTSCSCKWAVYLSVTSISWTIWHGSHQVGLADRPPGNWHPRCSLPANLALGVSAASRYVSLRRLAALSNDFCIIHFPCYYKVRTAASIIYNMSFETGNVVNVLPSKSEVIVIKNYIESTPTL